MPFSDTSDTTLAYKVETTFDTMPSASGWKYLRMTGESLNTSIESATSEEIDPTRQVTDSVHVSGQSAGDINLQLSYNEYNAFLESALQSSGFSSSVSTATSAASASGFTVSSGTDIVAGSALEDGNGNVFFVKSISGTSVSTVENASGATGSAVHTGYIANGTSQNSYSFEKKFESDGTAHYFTMSGMTVDSMNLSLSSGAILNGSFSFQGASGAASGSSSAGTPTASTTNELMNSVNNVTGPNIYSINTTDGSLTAISATFQEFSLTASNNLRPQAAVGSLYPVGIGAGRINVEMSATIYFSDRSLYDVFIANGWCYLTIVLTDADGNRIAVAVPGAKIATHEVVATGPDADVLANITFQGIKDTVSNDGSSGSNSTIVITKIDA